MIEYEQLASEHYRSFLPPLFQAAWDLLRNQSVLRMSRLRHSPPQWACMSMVLITGCAFFAQSSPLHREFGEFLVEKTISIGIYKDVNRNANLPCPKYLTNYIQKPRRHRSPTHSLSDLFFIS